MGTLIFSLFLVACGSEAETRSFITEAEGASITLEFTYKDDRVLSQKAKSEMTYAALGFESKEEAEKELKESTEAYTGLDGVSYQADFQADKIIEETEINFDDLDYEKVKDIPGLLFEGDPKDGISMEKSAELLLTYGFTEQK